MKIIATNKRASYDYNISLKLDAGLILTGSEVKSLRNNSSSIKESYVEDIGSELYLCNCFIKKYVSANEKENNPTRKRKLLLNKKELNKILGSVKREGFSVVPITIYFNDKGLVKLNIGLGKGKKKYDKRESQKLKDWNKNKQRILKNN
tara:strand:+ start:1161 stop:1607 length:447 start_codon:yes stop_codon:yes gene_type:complete